MIPQIDLFHQLVFQQDGFVAIADFTKEHQPQTDVYTPDGVWCGCTGASHQLTVMADIKHIINFKKQLIRQNSSTKKRKKNK